MSLHAYLASRELEVVDHPFYGLIMAAMRRADTANLLKLQDAFPEVWEELNARYNAPAGGLFPGEHHPTTGYKRLDNGDIVAPDGEVISYGLD